MDLPSRDEVLQSADQQGIPKVRVAWLLSLLDDAVEKKRIKLEKLNNYLDEANKLMRGETAKIEKLEKAWEEDKKASKDLLDSATTFGKAAHKAYLKKSLKLPRK